MSLLVTLALAQPFDEEALAPDPLVEENARLGEELEALRAELERASGPDPRAVALGSLLADVAILQDPREEPEGRAAALSRMVDRALALEEEGLARQLLLGAAMDPDPTVSGEATAQLQRLVAVPELDWLARNGSPTVQQAAVAALEQTGDPEAGKALFALATDTELSREVRSDASDALQRSFPELLEEKGTPQAVSTGVGIASLAVGNAVFSGTVLSSVGVVGRSDSAAAIGVVGGGAIGAGTGVLYGLNNPVGTDDGMRYASSVGWGLANGQMLGEVATWSNPNWRQNQNTLALTRAVGVTAGAGQAWWVYKNDETDLHDVWESNVAGWLGIGTAVGAARMADLGERNELFAASIGSLAGLGLQAGLRGPWDPHPEDAAFAVVTSGSLTWAQAFLTYAYDLDVPYGTGLFVSHAGGIAGLAGAHFLEPTWKQDTTMAWGMVLGNSLGAGIPLLANSDERTVSQVMIPAGLAGTAAGYALGGRATFTGGDRTMLGVGVPMLTLQALGYGGVLLDKANWSGQQMAGLTLVGLSGSGIGLTALSQRWDPDSGQVLMVGSGGLWGAWYGVLTPIALGMDGEPSDLLLVTLLASDAGMLGAGALTYGLDVHPRSTLVPQLGGLSGATVGAMAVGLVSANPRAASAGALLGSVGGFVGGTALELQVLGPRRAERVALGVPSRRLDLPGTWSFGASPWAAESGDLGVYGQVSWRED